MDGGRGGGKLKKEGIPAGVDSGDFVQKGKSKCVYVSVWPGQESCGEGNSATLRLNYSSKVPSTEILMLRQSSTISPSHTIFLSSLSLQHSFISTGNYLFITAVTRGKKGGGGQKKWKLIGKETQILCPWIWQVLPLSIYFSSPHTHTPLFSVNPNSVQEGGRFIKRKTFERETITGREQETSREKVREKRSWGVRERDTEI